MQLDVFIQKVQTFPVVDMRVFPPAERNSLSLKVQISRWVKSGKLIQLKRGLYLLAEPYRKISPQEFFIAGALKAPSYVSLEKALEYHGLIPEAVSVYTSVTTKRTETLDTPVGRYVYQHVKPSLFWGYTSATVEGQTFFMAEPEKALLDLFYLQHIKVTADYLAEMRLQNVGHIKSNKLLLYARRFQKKNLVQAAKLVAEYVQRELKGVKRL